MFLVPNIKVIWIHRVERRLTGVVGQTGVVAAFQVGPTLSIKSTYLATIRGENFTRGGGGKSWQTKIDEVLLFVIV